MIFDGALADFIDIELAEPEVNGDAAEGEETVYTLNLLVRRRSAPSRR